MKARKDEDGGTLTMVNRRRLAEAPKPSDAEHAANARESVDAQDGATEDIGELPADEVAANAYSRYVNRGYEDGHDVEDWLAAEEEVRGQLRTRRSDHRISDSTES